MILDLNREPLRDERLKCLQQLVRLQNMVRLRAGGTEPADIEERNDARAQLARAPLPETVFSAMAADFLREHDIGADAEAP